MVCFYFVCIHLFKFFRRKDNILLDTSSNTDEAMTPIPLKKPKPSIPTSNVAENSSHQNSPSFHQLANNTLLQKSICT